MLCENVIVRGLTITSHGPNNDGVVIGSDISDHCRYVFVENCSMDSPNFDRALRFKNNTVRGGVIENVFRPNVQLERVTGTASPRVLFIRGFEGAVVDGIRVSHSAFYNTTESEVASHAGSIHFHDVVIEPANKPASLNTVPPPS